MVGIAYASGRFAKGECQKCGLEFHYLQLVSDGHWRHLRVCPNCYDDRHPQERLVRVSDPIALWRPAPDSKWPPTVSVLTGELVDPDVRLIWSASTSPDSGVAGYRVYRVVGLAAAVLLADLQVERNFIGAIAFEPLTYLDIDPSAGSYEYTVQAYDLRGFTSEMSNPIPITVT